MSIRLTPGLSPRFAANLSFPDSNGSKADQKAEAQYRELFKKDETAINIDVFLHPVTQSVQSKLCDLGKLGDPVKLKPIQNAKDIKHGFSVRDVMDERFYALALKKGAKPADFANHLMKIFYVLKRYRQPAELQQLQKNAKDINDFVQTLTSR